MPLHQAGAMRWSSSLAVCLAIWIGLLAGCSGGDDSAFSSETNPVGGSASASSFPEANDTVVRLVSDGGGCVDVGGRFTRVGQLPRQTLAHVTADGAVDPSWDPAADGPVTALVLENQALYIGGSFFSVNGVERWRLAA